MEARPQIYRIVVVRMHGVLVLDGRCGTQCTVHLTNVAPCHLTNIDTTQDHRLARPHANVPCCICKSPEMEGEMLLCYGCGKAYHLGCMHPPLASVQEGDWLCSQCRRKGVSLAPKPAEDSQRKAVHITRKSSGNVRAAKSLHDQVVRRSSLSAPRNKEYGRVEFLGLPAAPKCFQVKWLPHGTVEHYDREEIKTILLPEGAILPKDIMV